jgi:hypothetical protein
MRKDKQHGESDNSRKEELYHSVADAARKTGINENTLRARIRRGMTLEQAAAVAVGELEVGNKSRRSRVPVKLHWCLGEQLSIPDIARKYGLKEHNLRANGGWPVITIDGDVKLCTIEQFILHTVALKMLYRDELTGGIKLHDGDAWDRLRSFAKDTESPFLFLFEKVERFYHYEPKYIDTDNVPPTK